MSMKSYLSITDEAVGGFRTKRLGSIDLGAGMAKWLKLRPVGVSLELLPSVLE